MCAPCAQVKIISICLDFIVIALFSLIVFQFLRDFKLNKGLYGPIDAWSFRIEHKTFLRCCVVNPGGGLHHKLVQSLSRLSHGFLLFSISVVTPYRTVCLIWGQFNQNKLTKSILI